MVIADVTKDIVVAIAVAIVVGSSATNNLIEVGFDSFNDVVIRTGYILLNSSITDTVKVIVTSEDNAVSTLEFTFAKVIANFFANAKIGQLRHF